MEWIKKRHAREQLRMGDAMMASQSTDFSSWRRDIANDAGF